EKLVPAKRTRKPLRPRRPSRMTRAKATVRPIRLRAIRRPATVQPRRRTAVKWWMTALTAVSVVGVVLLPGVRRREPIVNASTWPTNQALTVRPIAAAGIESARALEANENLVVVSRPAVAKPLASSEPPA